MNGRRYLERRRCAVLAGAVILCAGLALTGAGDAMAAPTTSMPAGSSPAATPHVMTIIMENTDYSQFAGSPAMPYLNELGHEYADFTQAYGWHYPSLPNYLELLSGSHDGVNGDCDITDPTAPGSPTRRWSTSSNRRASRGTRTTRRSIRGVTRVMVRATTPTGTTPSATSPTSRRSASTSRTSTRCSPTSRARMPATSTGSYRTSWTAAGTTAPWPQATTG